jgi:hypothetical protein
MTQKRWVAAILAKTITPDGSLNLQRQREPEIIKGRIRFKKQ